MNLLVILLALYTPATTSNITIRLLDGTTVGTAGCSVSGVALSVPGNQLSGVVDCRPDQLFRDGFDL
jgi:hypothetical protein